ncbi:MAG: DUF2064 domain-containing protein [Oscillochloris sp.]|nr:DUF2064 domain-containing protein [Oscillochloris sp.]
MQRMIITVNSDERVEAVFGRPLRIGFVQDLVETAAALRGVQIRICTPATAEQAFVEALSLGPVILVAGDVPHLPFWRLADAFDHLEASADFVVGPAESGGCYLIGMRNGLSASLDAANVLDEAPANLLTAARSYGWNSATLPGWYRVLNYADLARLAADLGPFPATFARHTRALLDGSDLVAQALGA